MSKAAPVRKTRATAKMKAKAKQLARPLHTRPAALAKHKQSVLLRNEHLAIQDSVYKRNEYDRMTGQVHSGVNPGLHAELVRERSKLLN
jgi:hypothetical protein